MSTSKNALLQFEAGQPVVDFAKMTDSGDHIIHTISGGNLFSKKSGFEAVVRPNGMVTGKDVITPSASVDEVTVAGFTAYLAGVLKTITATTMAVTRGVADVAKIVSVTVTSAGAIAEIEGDESADTSFSETRGAAGGPPSIPLTSVEVAQIRMTGNTSGVISSDEIFQIVGSHTERFDYPAWEENSVGFGDDADSASEVNAHIVMDSALPMIHGATPDAAADSYKEVYVKYYAPTLVSVSKAWEFKACEQTHTGSSQNVYGGKSVGSVAASLGQGGFMAIMTDNITDALLQQKNQVIVIKHYPDKNKPAHTITQGTLGVKRDFPVDSQNKVTCTITAEDETASFAA